MRWNTILFDLDGTVTALLYAAGAARLCPSVSCSILAGRKDALHCVGFPPPLNGVRGFLLRGLAVEHGCLRNFQHFGEPFPPPVRLFFLVGRDGVR